LKCLTELVEASLSMSNKFRCNEAVEMLRQAQQEYSLFNAYLDEFFGELVLYWLYCFMWAILIGLSNGRFSSRWLPRLGLTVLLAGSGRPAAGYSALAHQAVIDSCWARGLVPVLQRRYPGATPAQLREARAYAYGGAVLQDLGYFPGNAPLFSDLTHYVRTGDFVRALLDEAHDRNELAFALGALAHYVADAMGHPAGANAVTGAVFPELQRPAGAAIHYAEAPRQHTQVEFAFDVAQVAAGRYYSAELHAAIGLRLCQSALERAFRRTYGLPLQQVLPHPAAGLALFHFVTAELLLAAVRASQHLPPRQVRGLPVAEQRQYFSRLNTARFQRRGRPLNHLSTGMRLLVVLTPTLPRLGLVPLLGFRPLPHTAEAVMRASLDESVSCYLATLTHLDAALPNVNLDTGEPTRATDYPLADRTYAAWVRHLARRAALELAGR